MELENGLKSSTNSAIRDFEEKNNSKRNKILIGCGVGVLLLGGAGVGVYFGTQALSNNNQKGKGLTLDSNTRQNMQTTESLNFGATAPVAPPSRVDWTSDPTAVSPVKDQQQCGDCWAFATAEAVESAYGLATNTKITPLSPQQLTSCDTSQNNCNGGDPASVIQNYLAGHPLTTDAYYPFVSGSGNSPSCDSSKEGKGVTYKGTWAGVQVAPSSSSVNLVGAPCYGSSCPWTSSAELNMQNALLKGPVQINIDASDWSNYQGGIVGAGFLVKCTGTSGTADSSVIDHAVQLVGYDTSSKPGYWIVKNQWGTQWGENGFIRLAMGKNTCCILCSALQATVQFTPSANTQPPVTVAPTRSPITSKPGTGTISASTTQPPASTTQAAKTTSSPNTITAAPNTNTAAPPSNNYQPCNSNTITSVKQACYVTAATASSADVTKNFHCQSNPDKAGYYYCCYVGGGWFGSLSMSSSTSNGVIVKSSCIYLPFAPSIPSSSSSTTTTPAPPSSSTVASQCCSYDSAGTPYYCWTGGYCTDVYNDQWKGYYDSTGSECYAPSISGGVAATNTYGSGC